MRDAVRCWSARNVLDLYVDGRLSSARMSRVRGHLDSCRACAAAAEALSPVKSSSVAVPEGLAASIKQALRSRAAAPEPAFAWPAFRPAQAAALVYLALLWAAPGFYGAPSQAGSAVESEVLP